MSPRLRVRPVLQDGYDVRFYDSRSERCTNKHVGGGSKDYVSKDVCCRNKFGYNLAKCDYLDVCNKKPPTPKPTLALTKCDACDWFFNANSIQCNK